MLRSLAVFLMMLGVTNLRAAEPKPNILVILADDLGYHDISSQGGKDVPTPNIDALASSGIRCTSGYVSSPYCSSSRAGFLTGRYQQRWLLREALHPRTLMV
jgi:arylsulfatase A-like enzyme